MPIEQVSPGLEGIIDLDQEVQWLASGFGGNRHLTLLPEASANAPRPCHVNLLL